MNLQMGYFRPLYGNSYEAGYRKNAVLYVVEVENDGVSRLQKTGRTTVNTTALLRQIKTARQYKLNQAHAV